VAEFAVLDMVQARLMGIGQVSRPVDLAGRLRQGGASVDRATGDILTDPARFLEMGVAGRLQRSGRAGCQ